MDRIQLSALTEPLPVRWSGDDGNEHIAEFSRLEVTAAEVIQRVVNAHPVRDLHISEPTIEEVVRQIYREGAVVSGERHDG